MQISLPVSASGWRYKTASGGGLAIGLLGGASGSAMVFGLDSKLLAMTIAALTPIGNLLPPHDSAIRLLRSAKGMIIWAGVNAGLQAGAGMTVSLSGLA